MSKVCGVNISGNEAIFTITSVATLLKKVEIPKEKIDSVYKYQVDALKVAFYGLE